MVKFFAWACLIAAAAAAAVPGDDWKNYNKCPAPETKIEYKTVEKYVPK